MTTTERTQVLVVGGALTGLSSALFLAAHGVDVTVVERHRDLLSHPRLRGITPRTVELYRELGLENAIREQSFLGADAEADGGDDGAVPFVPLRAETLADEYDPVAEAEDGVHVDPRRYSPCTYGSIDQDKLEHLLRARARELGARLHYATEFVSFDADAEGVTAVLRNRPDESSESAEPAAEPGGDPADLGGTWTIRSDYLIAADGARSPIRHALGIESDGPGVLFETITAMVHADLVDVVRGRPIGIAYLQRPRPFSTMMAHDTDGTEWLFSTGIDPERESLADFGDDRIAAMVADAAGKPGVPVTVHAQIPGTEVKVLRFPIGAQVAREYARGRVFLVGDAARIQPPTGGFGGSTGVQDAHNLAWKLAVVLDGRAGTELLATYHQERRPYGELAMQQALARFGDRMAGGAATELLDTAAVTAGYRYVSSAVPDGPRDPTPVHPLELDATPGTRAPHRELPDGSCTLDLFGREFVLLGTEELAPVWSVAAEKCAAELGTTVAVHALPTDAARAYRLHRGEDHSQSGDHHQSEVHGQVADPAEVVLVRPDGFVAWRAPVAASDHPGERDPAGERDRAGELARVLRAVLHR